LETGEAVESHGLAGSKVVRPLLDQPLHLRDFVRVAFWLTVKMALGLVIGAALFETVGVGVGVITRAMGG